MEMQTVQWVCTFFPRSCNFTTIFLCTVNNPSLLWSVNLAYKRKMMEVHGNSRVFLGSVGEDLHLTTLSGLHTAVRSKR